MRLRNSSRCSIRLMPGSSARSVTALRARSIGSKSAMQGLGFELRRVSRVGVLCGMLGGRMDVVLGVGLRRRFALGRRSGLNDVEVGRRGGVGDGQAGGWRQDAQVAGCRNGDLFGYRLRLIRRLAGVFVRRVGVGVGIGGGGEGGRGWWYVRCVWISGRRIS